VLAAERLGHFRRIVDILDEDAEMMEPGVIHAAADLVGLEAQDGEVDRAVAQMMAVGERAVVRANDLEIERLDVEIGHRVGVLGGDGDVAQFCHGAGSPYSAACLTGVGSASAPAQPCSAMSNRTRSGPKNFFSK
jgi:hypothetical protein